MRAVSTLAIIVIAVVGVLILLAVGGSIAAARRSRAGEESFRARLEAANEHLALAHAQDKGWQREAMEDAAREAFASRFPDARIDELHLVHVVDRPGTEDDEAHFEVVSDGEVTELVLGRRGDAWLAR